MLEQRFDVPDGYRLGASLRILQHGPFDPTTRVRGDIVWRASRTPHGPVTTRLVQQDSTVVATMWGPGAEHAMPGVPALLGMHDDPPSYAPKHPLLRELARRFVHVRFPKTGTVVEHLVPTILEQKVPSSQAVRSYQSIVKRFSERAPGGFELWLPLDPERFAALPYHAVHRFGVERKRADTIRRACARAARLEEAAAMTPTDAEKRLRAIDGIGAWTAAEVLRVSHGDADAVSVGDFHIPHAVCFALDGRVRGTDERMLELLEDERPHRGRAIRYIELAGIGAPRFGPRLRHRTIAEM